MKLLVSYRFVLIEKITWPTRQTNRQRSGIENRKDIAGFRFEGRLTWLTLLAGAPASDRGSWPFFGMGDQTAKDQLDAHSNHRRVRARFSSSSAREHVVRPLQTMSNLLAALREGDYSIRARGAQGR